MIDSEAELKVPPSTTQMQPFYPFDTDSRIASKVRSGLS